MTTQKPGAATPEAVSDADAAPSRRPATDRQEKIELAVREHLDEQYLDSVAGREATDPWEDYCPTCGGRYSDPAHSQDVGCDEPGGTPSPPVTGRMTTRSPRREWFTRTWWPGLLWLHLGPISVGVADHRRYRPFSRCVGYHSRHVGPYCLRLRVRSRHV